MPGGRLTHQDRQRIASGLAAGLGYAEIARQLGRPTSTVSREVARNGGTDRYRADHAHVATGRRARRRKPVPPPKPPAAISAYGRDPEAVRGFAEQFAALLVQTGLPRMASRVLACLFTIDSGRLTAAELVHYLRVSPASVSKAIAYLERMQLVRRERDLRWRREHYVIDDDVWFGAWSASTRTATMWADVAGNGAEILGESTPAGSRLEKMGRFFARIGADMAGGPSNMASEDALTVLAALVHAGAALTVDGLAVALGWPRDRVVMALDDAEGHAETTDPVSLRRTGTGAYTVTGADARLTPSQRDALSQQAATRHANTSTPPAAPSPPRQAQRSAHGVDVGTRAEPGHG